MTRLEHLAWCRKRAIEEMDHSKDPKSAIISMASDLRKHPETNGEALNMLCIMQILMKPNMTRQEAIDFLDGFN
jgi:hypothetical protein